MRIFVAIVLLGFGCCSCSPHGGPQSHYRTVKSGTDRGIVKGGLIPGKYMESSPVVFQQQLLYIVSDRPANGSGALLLIIYDANGKEISRTSTTLCFISAFVVKGTLYVTGETHGKAIVMVKTRDLVHFSTPTVLFTAPTDITFFNSSVTPDDTGFMLAYEVCRDTEVCFNVRFKHSSDLKTWVDAGTQFQAGYYTACPTIRYVNGFYYVFYLSVSHHRSKIHLLRKLFDKYNSYSTLVSRSRDLKTWEQSLKTVIAPDGPDTSRNSSDLDLVEFDRQVRMLYSVSPQDIGIPNSIYGIRQATFNGTMGDFVNSFF